MPNPGCAERRPKPSSGPSIRRFLQDATAFHRRCFSSDTGALTEEDGVHACLLGLFLYLTAKRSGRSLADAETRFLHALLQCSLVHEGTTNHPRLLCESHLLYALRPNDASRLRAKDLSEYWGLLLRHAPERLSEDPLGHLYQTLRAKEQRKRTGQFFTPPELVSLALESLVVRAEEGFRILDPACGSGLFLLGAYDRLSKAYQEQGVTPEDAHRLILSRHLCGMDLDPIAVVLAEMNLFLRCPWAEPLPSPLRQGDFLAGSGNPNLLEAVDWIIGNPPWGGKAVDKTGNQENPASAEPMPDGHGETVPESWPKGSANPFVLFILRGLSLLKPLGRMTFLVPDALLDVKQYGPLRKLLLEQTTLRRLVPCGHCFRDLFAPVLLLETEKPKGLVENLPVSVEVFSEPGRARSQRELHPRRFLNAPDCVFNVAWREDLRELWRKMESRSVYLHGRAEFGLGIVTGDNGKFVKRQADTEQDEGVLVGPDVLPFALKEPTRFLRFDPACFQQVCPEALFRTRPKLIYRFIYRQLCFAVDVEGRLTLNNANLLIPHLPNLDIRYLCGLLNSFPLQSYYQHHVLSVKVLRANLERLPLAAVSKERQAPVVEAVERLRELSLLSATPAEEGAVADGSPEVPYSRLYHEVLSSLDDAVMDCYDLTPQERRRLRQAGLPKLPGR